MVLTQSYQNTNDFIVNLYSFEKLLSCYLHLKIRCIRWNTRGGVWRYFRIRDADSFRERFWGGAEVLGMCTWWDVRNSRPRCWLWHLRRSRRVNTDSRKLKKWRWKLTRRLLIQERGQPARMDTPLGQASSWLCYLHVYRLGHFIRQEATHKLMLFCVTSDNALGVVSGPSQLRIHCACCWKMGRVNRQLTNLYGGQEENVLREDPARSGHVVNRFSALPNAFLT